MQVVDEDGNEKPRAPIRRARAGCTNADECVGEIVNTAGVGPFEGYYNNADATDEDDTRFGWYWSGDLGYIDADGYLYFAGRNADWIRVDGENFPAGPIEEALRHAPDVVLAAVYGVPDDQAGDQVMAGLVLARRRDLRPRRVRGVARRAGRRSARSGGRATCAMLREPPTTGTNKIVKRTLRAPEVPARPRRRRPVLRARPRRRDVPPVHRRPTKPRCTTSFVRYGRERFWDL